MQLLKSTTGDLNPEDIILLGADVVALFPSLDGRVVAEQIMEEFIETEMQTEGIDWKELATYLAMNLDQDQINKLGLARVCPTRRYSRGPRPGITSNEAKQKSTKEEDSKWDFAPGVEAMDWEIKKIIAVSLQIAVETVFSNYIYSFGGINYRQVKGGPIGSRLTMAASRIVMGRWSHKVKDILLRSDIPQYLMVGYVDDIRMVMLMLQNGQVWDSKEEKFIIKEEKKIEAETWTKQQRIIHTKDEVAKMMGSVFSGLKFTTESQHEFTNLRMPTLDTEMWMTESGEIRYAFYRKEIGSDYCVMNDSAAPHQQKRAILAQEVVRRMKNSSEKEPVEDRIQILEDFSVMMTKSGYDMDTQTEIFISGLKCYERLRRKSLDGENPLHRRGWMTRQSRQNKKLTLKTSWYRKRKREDDHEHEEEKKSSKNQKREGTSQSQSRLQPSSVMFIEHTRDGNLAKRLRAVEPELEKMSGAGVKVVEKNGKKLKDLLVRTDPWAGEDCGRPDCTVCTEGEPNTTCRRRNMTYQNVCITCKDTGQTSIYIGETSRSLAERHPEHLADQKAEKEDSHMHQHAKQHHNGAAVYRIKPIRSYRSPLMRHISE